MKFPFLLSLFSACCRLSGMMPEKSVLVGSHTPIEAAVGEDVILPCHLEPPSDVHKLLVKWKRNQTNVHTYRSRADDRDSQDKSFKNRTRLFHDKMLEGNISLKLFNITRQDKGVYSCFVLMQDGQVKDGATTLKVVPDEQDSGRIVSPTLGPDTSTDDNNLSPAAVSGVVLGAVIAFGIGILIGIVIQHKCGQEREHEREQEGNDAVL